MDILLAILLLILIVWLFGDVLFLLLCRFVAFMLCMWLAMQVYHRLAKIVMDMGLTDQPHWASLISFLAVLAICWFLLHCIGVRVRGGPVGDGEAVALDGFRVGIICAICLAVFLMVASFSSGLLTLVSWISLCVIAVMASVFDVCAPSVMGRAAKWFD